MPTKTESIKTVVENQARVARKSALALQTVDTGKKDLALEYIAEELEKNTVAILAENKRDVEEAKKAGNKPAFLDRLTLNEGRLVALAKSVREVVSLPDPIGEITGRWRRPNGLRIVRQRVPMGVIAIIYESRPNVTVEAAVLCFKAGSATILRGGSEALNSNRILASLISRALVRAGLPGEAVQFIDTRDRAAVAELVKLDKLVDLVIPRGSEEMIRRIKEMSLVPVLGHGKGLCHIYVDKEADMKMAEDIVANAKTSRPGVCNAVETVLVHEDCARSFMPKLVARMGAAKVELRGDEKARKLAPSIKKAVEEDWSTEYLDLILAVKVVDSMEEAIDHINTYSSQLSESIITDDKKAAKKFLDSVDSAVVYHNASTRFTDGGQFGFGAEIGISTSRLHSRGPMGLRELTSQKYLVYGEGQVRS